MATEACCSVVLCNFKAPVVHKMHYPKQPVQYNKGGGSVCYNRSSIANTVLGPDFCCHKSITDLTLFNTSYILTPPDCIIQLLRICTRGSVIQKPMHLINFTTKYTLTALNELLFWCVLFFKLQVLQSDSQHEIYG